jgi:hypothetical protein
LKTLSHVAKSHTDGLPSWRFDYAGNPPLRSRHATGEFKLEIHRIQDEVRRAPFPTPAVIGMMLFMPEGGGERIVMTPFFLVQACTARGETTLDPALRVAPPL